MKELTLGYIFGRSVLMLDPQPCTRCGVPTVYKEAGLDVPLCPGPCTVAAWAAAERTEKV